MIQRTMVVSSFALLLVVMVGCGGTVTGPSDSERAYVEDMREWLFGPADCDQIDNAYQGLMDEYENGVATRYEMEQISNAAMMAGDSKYCEWYPR